MVLGKWYHGAFRWQRWFSQQMSFCCPSMSFHQSFLKLIFSNIILCHQREAKLKLGHDQITEIRNIFCTFFLPKLLYNNVENNTSLKPLSDVSLRSEIATLFFPPPISCREDCSELVTKVEEANFSNNVSRKKKKKKKAYSFSL